MARAASESGASCLTSCIFGVFDERSWRQVALALLLDVLAALHVS